MGRRSGVHPCQDPLGPAAHLRTDAPRGGSPDRQRCAVPGGADQAVRHPAGVLGARRRSGHPHHKTQAPGHRGHIRPTSSSPCTPEPARRRKPAELTPVAMPVLKSPGRTARRRQPPILSEPTSWHDRNRAEPDPMRAASHPEGMMATAPESAFGITCSRRTTSRSVVFNRRGRSARSSRYGRRSWLLLLRQRRYRAGCSALSSHPGRSGYR